MVNQEPTQPPFQDANIPQKRPASDDLPNRRHPTAPFSWANPRSAVEFDPWGGGIADMMSSNQVDVSTDDYTWYNLESIDIVGHDVDIFARDRPDAPQLASVEDAAVCHEGPNSSRLPLQVFYSAGRTSGSVAASPEPQDQEVQEVPRSVPGYEPKKSRNGPSESEWEQRKELLRLLYGKHGHTLRDVREIMKTAGFLTGASDKMYKTRFDKWGIKKNMKPKARRPALNEKEPHVSSDNDLKGMIEGVRTICKDHIRGSQGIRWSLNDEFRVVEDEWDDAFGSVVWFLQDLLKSPKTSAMMPKLEDIYDDIKPMVQELGFFSLPTILTLTFRMCDKLQETTRVSKIAGEFLRTCQKISEGTGSPCHEALSQVLRHAHAISQKDPEDLSDLIEVTFHFYILLIHDYAGSESATVLSLVSLYLAYINPESSLLDSTLDKLDRLLQRSEKVNGRANDATLDILGLAIFILQRTDQDAQLMQYCDSMKRRIEQRRGSTDGKLEGKLLERHLDALAVLAKLYQKNDTKMGNTDALDLMKEYQAVQEQCQAKQDGYGKILEEQLEEVSNRLEMTSLFEP